LRASFTTLGMLTFPLNSLSNPYQPQWVWALQRYKKYATLRLFHKGSPMPVYTGSSMPVFALQIFWRKFGMRSSRMGFAFGCAVSFGSPMPVFALQIFLGKFRMRSSRMGFAFGCAGFTRLPHAR
ncbi:MAG: hypothetical protein R6U86_08880, partial [Bacteroidales bacterium]